MKNYVIIGAGIFGESLAITLMELGHEVLVVDNNEDVINKIANFVTHAICADVSNPNILMDLGLENMDAAIVAIGDNLEAAVLATATLKELGVGQIVCKAKTLLHAKVLKKIGADEVIIPELDAGKNLANSMSSEQVIDFISIHGNYSVLEVVAPEEWVNKTILSLDARSKFGITILGIYRGEDTFIGNPGPETVILEKDSIVIYGDREEIGKIVDLTDTVKWRRKKSR